jgi:hypothetical protein
LLPILLIALIISLTAVANASGYTYELTSNYLEPNVPLGATVTVTAKTNDPNAYKVLFTWLNPAEQPELIETKTEMSDGSFSVATSTFTLNEIGDWDVYAIFLDKFGNRCFSIIIPVRIRHVSFNVIPEIPVIGTAGASIAMVLGLAFKMKRKPHKQTPSV